MVKKLFIIFTKGRISRAINFAKVGFYEQQDFMITGTIIRKC